MTDSNLPKTIDGNLTIRMFMDATDWTCEVGHASGGNYVYPSLEDAKRNLSCATECGIVEVELRIVGVALEGTGP